MTPGIKAALARVLCVVVALGPALTPAAAQQMTRADYESCQTQDEAAFRKAIEEISVQALSKGVEGVDFSALVGDEWRTEGLDELIDKRVDLAIADVRAETSLSTRLRSLIDKEKAQGLADAVAERTYRSDVITNGLERLSNGVAMRVGRQVELAIVDAAKPTLQCLEAYLNPRYGRTVSRRMTAQASKAFEPKGTATVTTGDLVYEGKEGLAGAAILLVRRQLANMARRMGQRIVGSVLGRLVSIVSGGVGLVLIGLELRNAWEGAFPIIAEEIKSEASKQKVRDELAAALSVHVKDQMHQIGTGAADGIIEVWQDFRRNHAKVLELAERNAEFRNFVDTTSTDSLARIDEFVGLILADEGETGVIRRLGDGTLHHAVNVMPEAGQQIARETRSLDTALQWSAIADDQLDKVVAHELHRRAKPSEFSTLSLGRVFALEDRLAIARIAALAPDARDVLFDLGTQNLKSLLRSLTETELETLASYLTGLGQGPRERVLRTVADNPGRMQMLASERVRNAIVSSADQEAAVAMMLRERDFDPEVIKADFNLVLSGKVKPILLWDRHPIAIITLGVLALVILLILRRLVFVRRPPRSQPPPSEGVTQS